MDAICDWKENKKYLIELVKETNVKYQHLEEVVGSNYNELKDIITKNHLEAIKFRSDIITEVKEMKKEVGLKVGIWGFLAGGTPTMLGILYLILKNKLF